MYHSNINTVIFQYIAEHAQCINGDQLLGLEQHPHRFVDLYEKRGTSSFFLLLRFLESVDSAIPEHYDDANHFSVRCSCGKLAAIPVYRESENERS